MENEKATEAYLRERVKALGGRAYKFVSPGNGGVPDRLVTLPGGVLFFAEIKGEKGRVTPLQQAQINFLQTKGQKVFVLRSKAGVDAAIRSCFYAV